MPLKLNCVNNKMAPRGAVQKRGKKEKDPNAPKRPQTAYFLWLRDNRPRLTKPGMSVTDVSKAAGAEWNKLTDKSKYEKMAAQDKVRYEKEMTAYGKKK